MRSSTPNHLPPMYALPGMDHPRAAQRLSLPNADSSKIDRLVPFADFRYVVGLLPTSAYAAGPSLDRRPDGRLALPPLVKEGIACDPFLREQIETVTSDEMLTPFCEARAKFTRSERIALQEIHSTLERVAAGVYKGSLIQPEHDKAPLAPTGAGRYYTALRRLRELLPTGRARHIGQVGLGLEQYSLIKFNNPKLFELMGRVRLQSPGAVIEPFELATLGRVTSMDWDERIVDALKLNKQEGVVIDDVRALNWASPRIDFLKIGTDPAMMAAARAQLESWRTYVYDDFCPAVLRSRIQFTNRDTGATMGNLVRIKDDIASAISPHCVDAVDEPLRPKLMPKGTTRRQIESGVVKPVPVEPYDVLWGTTFLGYHPLPLQFTTLFKMVDALTMGGILVVDHSMFRPILYPLDYSFAAATEKLFALMGLDIIDVLERPLETISDVIIAQRTRESPWLDGRMEVLNRLGMNG